MVRVVLSEGWDAYVSARGWAVLPVWDDKNRLAVGVCRVILPSGTAFVVKGGVKEMADKMESDSSMQVVMSNN